MRAVRTGLQTLLPLRPDQSVLILGQSWQLAFAVAGGGITPILVIGPGEDRFDLPNGAAVARQVHAWLDQLPFSARSIDVVLIPVLAEAAAEAVLQEAGRVLRPGGGLVLCVASAPWWRRRVPSRSGPSAEVSLGRGHRELAAAGFDTLNHYGIHGGYRHTPHLIPLEHPSAVRYFYQRLFVPRSAVAAATRRGAPLLTLGGLQHHLFRQVAIVARRPPDLEP
jgi:SAM-dependent methyltransferase